MRAVHEAIRHYAELAWSATAAGRLRPARPGSWVRELLSDAIGERPERVEHVAAQLSQFWAAAGEPWLHPARMAYIPATTSIPALVAEVLAATRNSHVWPSNIAAAQWERATTDQLARMLGLAPGLTWAGGGAGVVLGSATSGVQQALLGALIRTRGLRWRQDGVRGDERVYVTSQTHGSVARTVLAAGLGQQGLRVVVHDPDTGAMSATELAAAVAEDVADGLCPVMVVATVGTTASAAVDDLVALGAICASRGLWLHVDAAWCGAFAVLPEHRNLLAGNAFASSLVVSPHKLLRTGLGCSVLWTRWPDAMAAAMAVDQPYLANGQPGEGVDPRGLQLPTGRPDRALVLGMTLRCLGQAELRRLLRRNLGLAQRIGIWATAQPQLESRTRLGLVLLRVRDGSQATQALLDAVHRDGQVLLSSATIEGQLWIRIAPGG
ncbi:LOW QUALITY PROTEIN: aromatic-L-amino-acid decarboxylase, partial [Kutzneria sp. 744]